MAGFSDRLRQQLQARRASGLWRERPTLTTAQGPVIRSAGRALLNFASNDYLGLANHPAVVDAFTAAARDYGVGSGASALVSGFSQPQRELEEALAAWTGRPRALLFGSGYAANQGVLTTLLAAGDQVFEDRLNHASLLDGGLYSGARFRRFAHNDPLDLDRKLGAAPASGHRLAVVDGVFSMDGDTARLPELAGVARRHGAWLMVDDAHGIGTVGPAGAGSVSAAGLTVDDVPILVGTLGKALGTSGAFVAGSSDLVEALVQQCRHYIYTTAAPPAVAAATLAALDRVQAESWRRERLQQHIQYFRRCAGQLKLELMASDSAIQPLLVGSSNAVMVLGAGLRERGMLVGAIRPPTVPAGQARLRITLSAAHEREQIDQLVEALGDITASVAA